MSTVVNNNVENIAKYRAIGLLSRSAVDKLADNRLAVISSSDSGNLQADVHALSAQTEVLNKNSYQLQHKHLSTQLAKSANDLPNPTKMTKEQVNQELNSYGFTEEQIVKFQGEIKTMIINYIKNEKAAK